MKGPNGFYGNQEGNRNVKIVPYETDLDRTKSTVPVNHESRLSMYGLQPAKEDLTGMIELAMSSPEYNTGLKLMTSDGLGINNPVYRRLLNKNFGIWLDVAEEHIESANKDNYETKLAIAEKAIDIALNLRDSERLWSLQDRIYELREKYNPGKYSPVF